MAGVVRLRDAPADHDAGVEGAAVDGERGVALQDGRERPAGALFIASVTRFAVLPAIGVVGFIALGD